ncbi:hypothetical protein HXX76_005493 [Chlamydomonas incerta]|uniref:Leucine-rich repeat-containing N-terminal plant-type domain-containing protein n=1 Tax=Chlamydomonas incerta TaxID=51695 RepID=A0A835W6Z6_CHLIN|nr:hypothetical protein HXX76_005493 [Chlamydomonas incerta]|eukprot:KAG2437876.1 hypothetical protein HXX76_005493 [Chlamydomonas incerta]
MDAAELVFGLAAAELGGNNVTLYLENYSLLGLQFTLLAHVHRADAALSGREARLLAELGAQCCRPRSVGLWCTRLSLLSAALASPRPTAAVAPRAPEVCSFPEVLCSQPTGPAMGPGMAAAAGGGTASLLKLWMPAALDCDGSWGALAGLAAATSLAWLDVSLSALEFPLVSGREGAGAGAGAAWVGLEEGRRGGRNPVVDPAQSSLAPLLASPALSHVVLTDASLTGPLAYTYGNNTAGSSSSGSNSGSSNSSSGSGATDGGSGGGAAAAQPAAAGSCEGLAPPGRRLLALSGNGLSGPVPDCLAAHAGLVELQLAMNLALTSLPGNWSGASSLRHLDVSGSPALRGPLTALPPALVHLNASGTSLGGGIPALPPTLYTLDMLEAGLVGGIAGAPPPPPPPPGLPAAAGAALEPPSSSAGGGGSAAGSGSGGDAGGAGGDADAGVGIMHGWSDCVNLTYVDVGSNVLRGGVPGLPPSVLVLYLDNNALTGPLPGPLPPGLIILNASANALSGPLPRTQLDSVRFLDLSRNRFSGGLPSLLAGSSQLIYLNASFNNISGTLALFAFKLRSTPNSLQVLDLSHNSLSGTVPSYLSQLAVFSVQGALPSFPRVLDLSYNRLSGSVPDFVFRLLPPVVWSCRCLLMLALGGGGNQLTCPANAPSLDSTSLYILWLYQVNCVDSQTNITYSLAQWLTPGFQRLTLPDASAAAAAATGNASAGSGSDASGSSSASGSSRGRSPGTSSAAADAGGYCDGSDQVAAASALCTYGPNPFARPGQGSVPDAIKALGWRQVMSLTTAPAGSDGNSVPVRLSSSNSSSDMPWPLANILTIVLAALTAAIVLLIVIYLCVRSWVVRRERARRRSRRREMRAARLAGQRQALWADRMAQMEREAAQQDQGAVQQATLAAAAADADAAASGDTTAAEDGTSGSAGGGGVVVTATGSRPHVGAVELQSRHARAPAGAAAAAAARLDDASAAAAAPDAAGGCSGGGAGAAAVGAAAQQLQARGAVPVQAGRGAAGSSPAVQPAVREVSEEVVLRMPPEASVAAGAAGRATSIEAEAPATPARTSAVAGGFRAGAETAASAPQEDGPGRAAGAPQ